MSQDVVHIHKDKILFIAQHMLVQHHLLSLPNTIMHIPLQHTGICA